MLAKSRYFTPNEVCTHNTIDDLWVSFLGKVYDLTPLCDKYKGSYSGTSHKRAINYSFGEDFALTRPALWHKQ